MIKDNFENLLELALSEDLSENGDVTSRAIFSSERTEALLKSKDEGVLAGIDYFRRVFERVDDSIEIELLKNDGDYLMPGDEIARLKGPTVTILEAERTGINFLSFLSGIATETHKHVKAASEKGNCVILDTRKTLPGYRSLSKYAVTAGGGENHRMGLFDMVMIKDNHADAAGSITNAVDRVRRKWGDRFRIEVECRNLEEVREALGLKVDVIMLDNMDEKSTLEAVDLGKGDVKFEASGNMDLEKNPSLFPPRCGLYFHRKADPFGNGFRFLPGGPLMNRPPVVSDLIVVGSGIAGLSAAIGAAEEGLSVTVLTKADEPWYCNTWFAQGGIVGNGRKDSRDSLARDIIQAGDGLNWRESVNLLASEGPDLVDSLLVDRAGVKFSRNEKGELDLTKEAAHSVRRIYHDKDLSGRSIEEGLLAHVGRMNDRIRIYPGMQALDIITNSHNSTDSQERYRPLRAIGLYVLDVNTNEVMNLYGSSIILATGGIGSVYQHSSNPSLASGDGISMAYRAGAAILNAEFVQFHPTTLFHRDVKNFLISESLRGEGARLVNMDGERFMSRYSPDMMELAPRDEVSRAIYREIDRTGTPCVFLDARDIDMELKDRFPGIHEKCGSVGIDISTDLIPVVPAAHYFCGGIKVNLNGYTSLPGLMAVGETACTGVHGANRLASISLLEGLYYGYRAGKCSADSGVQPSSRLRRSIPEWIFPVEEDDFDPILVKNDRSTIRSLMWNYTGIIRNVKRLNRALSDLNYFSHRIDKFYREARLSRKLIELRNTVETATIITRAAKSNSCSIGCHYVES